MTAERRHFARIAFDTAAELATPEARLDVKVLDLSLKGALLQMPVADIVSLGTPCLLTVRLAEPDAGIAMSVEVAHVQGAHLGLLCRSIDVDSATHLRRLIELNLGHQGLLDRELMSLVAANPTGARP